MAVADRLDTLVGLSAVVGVPKATADPFGLRRAAYGAVQTLVASGVRCDLRAALKVAASLQPVVWPFGYCPPHHPTHFESSSLE